MGMSGVEHLLKAAGIDKNEIMAGIEGFKNLATQVNERQTKVDSTLNRIEEKQFQIFDAHTQRMIQMEEKIDRLLELVNKTSLESGSEKTVTGDVDAVLDHLALTSGDNSAPPGTLQVT